MRSHRFMAVNTMVFALWCCAPRATDVRLQSLTAGDGIISNPTASDLQGRWVTTACTSAGAASGWFRQFVDFNGSTVAAGTAYYFDSTCSQQSDENAIIGTFETADAIAGIK